MDFRIEVPLASVPDLMTTEVEEGEREGIEEPELGGSVESG